MYLGRIALVVYLARHQRVHAIHLVICVSRASRGVEEEHFVEYSMCSIMCVFCVLGSGGFRVACLVLFGLRPTPTMSTSPEAFKGRAVVTI